MSKSCGFLTPFILPMFVFLHTHISTVRIWRIRTTFFSTKWFLRTYLNNLKSENSSQLTCRVLLVHKATPETILQFHDELSNKLPTLKGKWSFSFKIFRNNIYSVPPELAETHETSPDTKFLYTWAPSYLNDSCVTLINKNTAAVLSNVVQEEVGASAEFAIPNDHLHKGATTGLNDLFDNLVNQRMQSLWTQRQVIKGDGGQIYDLENGNLVIRTANVTLHGNFRGLLIQLEVDHSKLDTTDVGRIFRDLAAKYDIPLGNLCHEVMDEASLDEYGDLALQYAEILNF